MRIESARDLGLRMRDQRQALRMSQAELARSAGASRSWVIQMERGNPGAEVGLVLSALKVLGLTMDVRAAAGGGSGDPDSVDAGQPHVIDLAAILQRVRGEAP